MRRKRHLLLLFGMMLMQALACPGCDSPGEDASLEELAAEETPAEEEADREAAEDGQEETAEEEKTFSSTSIRPISLPSESASMAEWYA